MGCFCAACSPGRLPAAGVGVCAWASRFRVLASSTLIMTSPRYVLPERHEATMESQMRVRSEVTLDLRQVQSAMQSSVIQIDNVKTETGCN